MRHNNTAFLGVLVASFAIALSGSLSTADAQLNDAPSKVTGCLTKKGQLKNLEFGENPRKKCHENQTLVMIPLLAAADDLCGNGQIEGAEQCDDGAANGSDGVCTGFCKYNCPCDYSAIQFYAFTPEADFITIESSSCIVQRTGANQASNLPFMNVDFLGENFNDCHILNFPPRPDVVHDTLTGSQATACARALEQYVTQLSAAVQVGGANADNKFECPIGRN